MSKYSTNILFQQKFLCCPRITIQAHLLYNQYFQMTTINIFTETIGRMRSPITIAEIISDFKEDVRVKGFRKAEIRSEKLMKKYLDIEKRLRNGNLREKVKGWHQNQRKLFLSFLLAYCKVHMKRIFQISQREWNSFSRAFQSKSVLLMKYEAKIIERNSDRVQWNSEQESILLKCMNSKLKGKWSKISKTLFMSSEGKFFKDSKQIRQHWFNHMDQSKKKGQWTTAEDLLICKSVRTHGKQWSKIALILGSSRTQHMTKNRFNSLLNWSQKLFSCEQNLKQARFNEQQNDKQANLINKLIGTLESNLTNQQRLIQSDQITCKMEINSSKSIQEEEAQESDEEEDHYELDQQVKSQKLAYKQKLTPNFSETKKNYREVSAANQFRENTKIMEKMASIPIPQLNAHQYGIYNFYPQLNGPANLQPWSCYPPQICQRVVYAPFQSTFPCLSNLMEFRPVPQAPYLHHQFTELANFHASSSQVASNIVREK